MKDKNITIEDINHERRTTNDKSTSLTIVIPAFNESKRILKTLNHIDTYITGKGKPELYFVVIVDDGSTDNTKGIVTSWIQQVSKNKNCFELISYMPNHGKGYAIREAFLKTKTDIVLYTDADGASPIEEVEKLVNWIDCGFDIACGSRILRDKDTKVRMSLKRRFVGLVFHLILRLCNLANLKDTQCGFKLFKASAAKDLAQNQQCFNYSFDIEYLFLAKKFGYKIKEVPINWYHVEGSKVNLLRDSIKMLVEVLKIRFVYKYN